MIEKIEILQHRESCDFGCHSSEKARWLLGIVAYHHQVVVQLGEDRLNSLSVPLVSPQRRPPVLLVQPVRNFKGDVCRGKQVLLYWSTQISFVAKYHTVMIFPLNILQVMEVMYVGCGHVIGMYAPPSCHKGHGACSRSSACSARHNSPKMGHGLYQPYPSSIFEHVHSGTP